MSDAGQSWSGSGFGKRGGRFRFRQDLRIVHENNPDDGAVTIRAVDPETGKQYSFSEEEYFLCQMADGQNTLQAIQELHTRQFGHEMNLRDLVSFFRRLRILGLIERLDPPEGAGFAGRMAGPQAAGAFEGQWRPGQTAQPRSTTQPRSKVMSLSLFNPTWL